MAGVYIYTHMLMPLLALDLNQLCTSRWTHFQMQSSLLKTADTEQLLTQSVTPRRSEATNP